MNCVLWVALRCRDIRIKSSDETAEKMIKRETAKQLFGRPLNSLTPCAACKLLRRRCADHCPFSPYFSPHHPRRFAAVHRVFGAINVSKMLTFQRADAANSFVYEANLRLRDPVKGCMGAVSALQHQIKVLQTQLHAVRAEIFKYKNRDIAASAQILPPPTLSPLSPPPPSSSPSSSACSIYKPELSATDYTSISSDLRHI